jgi:hypothetical protein
VRWLGGPRLVVGLGPRKRRRPRERGKSGPRVLGCGEKRPEKKRNSFFFFFQFFKANFQKIFKSKFEFDQTTHLKNLNATA